MGFNLDDIKPTFQSTTGDGTRIHINTIDVFLGVDRFNIFNIGGTTNLFDVFPCVKNKEYYLIISGASEFITASGPSYPYNMNISLVDGYTGKLEHIVGPLTYDISIGYNYRYGIDLYKFTPYQNEAQFSVSSSNSRSTATLALLS